MGLAAGTTATWRRRKMPKAYWEWVDRNPLRDWRVRKRISIRILVEMLQTHHSALAKWENGQNYPNFLSMQKLIEITGMDDLAARWGAWLNERPTKGA